MSIRQNLCNRLSAIGLKQEKVYSLIDETLKWVSNSGIEWTISRLKDIKQYYIHQLAGEPYEFDTWVKTNRNGTPKGPWGSLDISNRKHIAQTLNALNVYTHFLSGSATQKQLSKFTKSASVEEDKTDTPIPIGPVSLSDLDPPKYGGTTYAKRRKVLLPSPKPWSDHVFGKTKAPLSDGTTVPEDSPELWLSDNGKVLGSLGLRLKQYRSDLLSAKVLSFVRETGTHYPSTGGKVAFLQEPGYKLRAIANPYRLWQVILDPLKSEMFRRLRGIEEDCTYDQMKGIEKVQSWLQDGHRVHSVDLSDATNLFPLSFQLKVLNQLLDVTDKSTKNQIDFFVRASRARWLMPDKSIIRWNRGQPLGLGPSFAVFAFSHHTVVKMIQREVGGDYVILGDDIAIKGDKLAQEYKRYMTGQLGCSISPQKTLTSCQAAEFAGRLILPDGDIPAFKWRAVSDRSFVDVVRVLGPTSKGLLRSRQRQVINVLSSVPEFLGGLGWNPTGSPLSERVQLAVDLGLMDNLDEELTAKSSSSVHTSTLNRILYSEHSGFPIVKSERESTLRPARSEIERVGTLLGISELIVDPDLVGGHFHTAAPSGDPRGPTTLDVLERKVKNWVNQQRETDVEDLSSTYNQILTMFDKYELEVANTIASQRRGNFKSSTPKP